MMAAGKSVTLDDILRESAAVLAAGMNPSPTARLDAEILICHVTGLSRAGLIAQGDMELDPDTRHSITALVGRRRQGNPVAHITGQREFFGLPLKVTPDTLIPRPETELLVEAALERIAPETKCRILDLGTGSGAVALAIKHECPRARVTASDFCEKALGIAKKNATHLKLDIELRQGSWFMAVPGERFDMIVSNPPYVPDDDPHLQQGDVRFEPAAALVSGEQGLDDIEFIIAGAAAHLNQNGWLILEHGYDQGQAVRELMRLNGATGISTLQDLAGLDRISLCQFRG